MQSPKVNEFSNQSSIKSPKAGLVNSLQISSPQNSSSNKSSFSNKNPQNFEDDDDLIFYELATNKEQKEDIPNEIIQVYYNDENMSQAKEDEELFNLGNEEEILVEPKRLKIETRTVKNIH